MAALFANEKARLASWLGAIKDVGSSKCSKMAETTVQSPEILAGSHGGYQHIQKHKLRYCIRYTVAPWNKNYCSINGILTTIASLTIADRATVSALQSDWSHAVAYGDPGVTLMNRGAFSQPSALTSSMSSAHRGAPQRAWSCQSTTLRTDSHLRSSYFWQRY